MTNPMDMLKQVQQMQADMAAAQEALANTTVEATVGGGVVRATVTGDGELRAIKIDPERRRPRRHRDARGPRRRGRHRGDAPGEGDAAAEARRGHGRHRPRLDARRPGWARRFAQPVNLYEGVMQTLIDELGRLPGIGPKSAQRIAFYLLKVDALDAKRLARRDRGRQGPRHLVPAVLQHLRRRALRVLSRRTAR